MATVLVTDAEQRSALAVARSLGKAGHAVHVTATSARTLAGSSRHVRSITMVPDPLRNATANAAAHAALVTRLGAQVVIPIAEPTALALVDVPSMRAIMPFPEASAFRRVCDKAAVLSAANHVGIRVPKQLVIHSHQDVLELRRSGALDDLPMPAIVKPSRSVAGSGSALLKLPVRYANSVPELLDIVESTASAGFPLLLQERVFGSGLGVFHLMWEGRELAAFAHRRIRERPPTGGVSTLRESISMPISLHERSLALLSALEFTHGVAMVEFKAPEHSEPALMEINARFWGSLQLAIDAGVDFPAMLVQAALGKASASPFPYRCGVKSRWFWGDVDHAIARVRSQVDVNGSAAHQSMFAVLREVFLHRDLAQVEEVCRLDDIKPFFAESLRWITRR